MKLFILLTLVVGMVFADEPSAFESQSGATKKELQSLKKDVSSYVDKIIDIERQIQRLNTSFEGLSSVHHSQSTKLKEVHDNISDISNKSDSLNKSINDLQSRVDLQDKNIKLLSDSLTDIKDSISQIRNIVSDIGSNSTNEQTSQASIEEKNVQTNDKKDTFTKDINKAAEIFKEARSLTYNNKFEEAADRYKWLAEINHRKAESVYMLGNIAYATNKYNDALHYYKESATLDDKAKYMPRLLLNTANSFRVINDIDNAKKFYNSLLSLFPDSVEAKEANKHLNKLKSD